jgi:hypothetical protein
VVEGLLLDRVEGHAADAAVHRADDLVAAPFAHAADAAPALRQTAGTRAHAAAERTVVLADGIPVGARGGHAAKAILLFPPGHDDMAIVRLGKRVIASGNARVPGAWAEAKTR